MACEFCGGRTEELARTSRHVWVGCRDCHRSWKDDADGHPPTPASGEHDGARLHGATLRGSAIALLAVALAFATRFALKPIIGDASPFLLFTPALMIAATYGGLVPGLLATALSALLGSHFFLRTFGETGMDRWDRIALFILIGVVITTTSAMVRSERRRLADSLWREQVSRAEAEAASTAKDEFLALASHELQTPLAVALGWASMIRTRQLSGPMLAQAIDTIERNARLSSKLVEDVLDTSRIVSGSLRLEPQLVELTSIVAAAVEQVRPAIAANDLTLVSMLPGDGWHVLADPVRLQQVFTNLLSNAAKFTPAGGRITIEMQRGDAIASVVVRDTGVGIAPEFLPRLFQRFEQDPQTLGRSRRGLGLGLSIARHFVERHGGTIRAASEGRGRGSSFTVELPLAAPPAAEDTGGRARLPSDALSSISVLLVEDDEDTRMLLSQMLELYGADVTAARSAGDAVRFLETHRPDVIVSDLRMSAMDGYALIKDVRAHRNARIASIPAASITASLRPDDRDRALRSGFQIHLQKPVAAQELAAAVLTLSGSSDAVVTH